jgi:hypothetical protein
MISLNQLEQLIGINQTLSQASSSTTTGSTGTSTTSGTTTSGTTPALTSAATAGLLASPVSSAVTNQLPFNPNTMMPLLSGNLGATAASINSSLNPTTMGLSGSNTSTSGGK